MRQEADGIRRYCHVGTGNYNPQTATPLRGRRPAHRRSRPRRRPHRALQLPHRATAATCDYRKLLVAPDAPPQRRCASASRARPTRGPAGRITMKMNSLVDAAMIDALYAAAATGTRDRSARPRHLLPPPAACRGCRRRSACARSSAGSSSTRGSTASAPIPRPPSTSSAPPTSCPATSTAGSRRSCPSTDPTLRARSPRSSTIDLADDVLGMGARRRRHVAQGRHGRVGVSAHRRLQAAALAARAPSAT